MRHWGVILAAALAAVAALAPAGAWAQFGPTAVYVEPAEQKTVRESVELVGTAQALRRSTIGAEAAGRVDAMAADAGDFVKAGDPLCRMRTRPVELQLARAQGLLDSCRATLEKMEKGFRKEEIDQAEARAKAAQAGLERWTQDFERTKKLLADGASTQAEFDVTEAAFRQARETLAEAQASLDLVKSGNRPEDIARARADFASQAAAVAELQDVLDKMTVRMPFDGFVIRKMTEDGEWLSPGAPVAEIVDLGAVRILLDVPEKYLAGLTPGSPAPVVFDALGADREFPGAVTQIVPSSAVGTHTLMVRVDVKNTMDGGRPVIADGLLARVWLPVGKEHVALLVPKSAVIRQEGRDVVYTVSDKPPAGAAPAAPAPAAENAPAALPPKPVEGAPAQPPLQYAVAIPVRLVQGYGRVMEVESEGLKPGMPVITRGTYVMFPGAPVQVRPREIRPGAAGPRAEPTAAPQAAPPAASPGPKAAAGAGGTAP